MRNLHGLGSKSLVEPLWPPDLDNIKNDVFEKTVQARVSPTTGSQESLAGEKLAWFRIEIIG